MKKLIVILLVLGLCIPSASLASEDVVELEFMTWSSGDSYMIPLVDAFNESQDRIHVSYTSETTNGEAFQTKLLTKLSSGEGVDVFSIYTPDLYSRYVELGAILSLDDLIASNNFDMTPYGASVLSIQRGGKNYSLPFRKSFDLTFYNKTMLEEHGIELPENPTWDEFLDICAELTYVDPDGTQYIGLLGAPNSWANEGLISLLAQYNEFVTDDELPHLETCVQRIYDVFIGNPGTLSYAELSAMGGPAMGAAYMSGRTAFMVGGSFFIEILQSDESVEFEWDIAFTPIDPDGMAEKTAVGDLNVMGIASSTEHPQEAFEFLTYLCGVQGAYTVAENGMLPAYSTDDVLPLLKTGESANLFMEVLVESSVISKYCGIEDMTELNEMTAEEIQKMLIGEQTVEETCANWNARRIEIISAMDLD